MDACYDYEPSMVSSDDNAGSRDLSPNPVNAYQTRLRRKPFPLQLYAQTRSQTPYRARFQATMIEATPRQELNTARIPPPNVRVHLRPSDLTRQVLGSMVPGLDHHLLIVTLQLPPPGMWSNLLQLRIRPYPGGFTFNRRGL